jgi:uncharacterized protein YjbJ (UPF0337 family)
MFDHDRAPRGHDRTPMRPRPAAAPTTEDTGGHMSLADKAKNKIEEATGGVKEKLGEATGNEDIEAEGRADQAEGKTRQAGEHAKDAGRDLKDAAKNAYGK